uniref:Lipocalin/cytosolic fatty-acid binding domain-containing protein n=1 Tax=Amblyomma maculatum TaxID=34609 RepID=G3MTS7_AMBMU
MHCSQLFIVTALVFYSHGTSKEDFREALDTYGEIYLYWRSEARMYNSDWKCLSMTPKKVEADEYSFTQRYKVGDQWASNTFTGLLASGHGGDENATMTVTRFYGHEKNVTYTLRYWDYTHKCFIVSVTNVKGRTKCEMYQWDRIIDQRCAAASRCFLLILLCPPFLCIA